MTSDTLADSTLDRVLERLNLRRPQAATPEELTTIYDAWCRSVSFDNLLKFKHVRSANAEPLPGSWPEEFFQSWLAHGAGGTCWSSAGALHALLEALGFEAQRGIGTMLVAPHLPPNHGTVVVRFGDECYLVDTGMLNGVPFLLDAGQPSVRLDHGAWGCAAALSGGPWHITWRPSHQVEGLRCRIDFTGASAEDFRQKYEETRPWSPFNYSVYIRRNRGEEVVSIAYGLCVVFHADGSVTTAPLSGRDDRDQRLLEEFGISESLVRTLPEDVPMPPPPGSKSVGEAWLAVAGQG